MDKQPQIQNGELQNENAPARTAVNGGKRGKNNVDGEPSRKNIKKPRKGEINDLPEFPKGVDVAGLEAVREAMVNEMQKKNPNDSLIRKKHGHHICTGSRTSFSSKICFVK